MIKRNLKIILSLVLILLSSTIVYAVDPYSELSNYNQFSPESLVVYGTRSVIKVDMPCLEEFRVNRPSSSIVSDTQVTWKQLQTKNVILLGNPETNWYVATLSEAGKSPSYADWKNDLKDKYFVHIVKDAFVKGKDALIIAGYNDEQSKIACDYFLTNQRPMSYWTPPKTTGCIHARPSITISPSSNIAEVGKDTKFIYAVEIINNDNSECDSGVFSIWREYNTPLTVYDGFGDNLPKLPPIKPGESFKYAMQVSVSSRTQIGKYSISVGSMNDNSKIYASTANADLYVALNPKNEIQSSEKNVSIEIPKTEEKSAINQTIKCDKWLFIRRSLPVLWHSRAERKRIGILRFNRSYNGTKARKYAMPK